MKRYMMVIGLCLCVTTAHATLIDFTGAEGYVNGALNFGANAAQGWSGGGAAYNVSTNTGTMTMTWPWSLASSALNANLSATQAVYSFKSTFSFDRTGTLASTTADTELFRQVYSTTLNGDNMYATLLQRGGSYKIAFQSNSGGITGQYVLGGGILDTALGFGSGDNTSDALTMEFNLIRGLSATDWDIQVILWNGASQVASISGVDRQGTAAFFATDLDIGFHNTAATTPNTLISGGIKFDSIEYTAAAIPEPATMGLFVISAATLMVLRRMHR